MKDKQLIRGILISVAVIIGVSLLIAIGAGLYLMSGDEFERRGGVRLVLGVVTDEAIHHKLDQDALIIRRELISKGIPFNSSRRSDGFEMLVRGINSSGENDTREFLDNTYGQGYEILSKAEGKSTDFVLSLRESEITGIRESTVLQTMETIRRRMKEFGISRPRVRPFDENNPENQHKIIVEFPGADDPVRIKALIGETAQLELCLVKKDGGGPFPGIEAVYEGNGKEIVGYQILGCLENSENSGSIQYMVVDEVPVITGGDLKKARPVNDSFGNLAVGFTLNPEGAEIFADFTEAHIGEKLAIVLDDMVYSAPVIQARIYGEGLISGNFTAEEANDLALLLNSGSLPASVEVLEESHVLPVDD